MANIGLKGVKKKWITIVAPKEFRNTVIGESLGNLVGRTIETSYGTLTGEHKRQQIKLIFKINNIQNNQATTETIGYRVSQSYIKRGIRKGRDKLDDSFVCECQDKIKCKIKPLLITRGIITNSVKAVLKKETKRYFMDICSKRTFIELIIDLTINKPQRELKQILKKTYPVVVCEVRILKKL